MTSPTFSELVSRLIEAMGQQLGQVRAIPEGLLLQTGDGFLYAFLEDPTQVSLKTVQHLLDEVGDAPMKLAILTPGHLPLALTREVAVRRGSVVDGARFAELARGLGLGSYLGDEPRAPPATPHTRLLPSAQQLDAMMHRARTWLDWGVPALALRFYRQAATLKPEFTPARVGVARALLALGLVDDADRAFQEVLVLAPDNLDARLGAAGVLGARGRPDDEIQAYHALLREEPAHLEIRAHLVAALIADARWADARTEIETMLGTTPEDPQIRFLHAASLWKTGATEDGDRERDRARTLGLPFPRERALSEHLGLPPPTPPPAPSGPVPEAPAQEAPKRRRKAARRSGPRASRKRQRPAEG